MKRTLLLSLILGSSTLLTGCLSSLSLDEGLAMGLQGAKAMSLSDTEMREVTNQSCAEMDKSNRIAANNSQYGKRLRNITKGLPTSVDGVPLNYKVYLTNDVNAWAMPNGCIRVYSGLMDMMTDDEVRGVLGHEIGHVALGHSKNRILLAMMASLGRDMLAKHSSETVSALSRTEIGDIGEKFINAQFSQKQETAADDYSFDLHIKQKRNPAPIAAAFDKLAAKSGSSDALGDIMSSHPAPKKRADRVRSKIDKL